ncbi:MAG: hypothetical protein WDW38_011590 [Sanguina aurantia]
MEKSVLDALQVSPYGCDLILSAFIAACNHYRRATICQPFPAGIFPSQASAKPHVSKGPSCASESPSNPGASTCGTNHSSTPPIPSGDADHRPPSGDASEPATTSRGDATHDSSDTAANPANLSTAASATATHSPDSTPTPTAHLSPPAPAPSSLQSQLYTLFSPVVDRTPELRSCMAVAATLPSVSAMLSEPSLLSHLTPQALRLLSWVLTHPANALDVVALPSGSWQTDMQHRHPSWTPLSIPPNQQASHNLKLQGPARGPPFRRPIVAFHGTHFENLHSVLHNGLRSASGTRLQRNAAIFGKGIYLSARYEVAASFCQPADGWLNSMLGPRLRCLLVCEVDQDAVEWVGQAAAEATAATAAAATGPAAGVLPNANKDRGTGPPDAYMLVQNSEAVRLLYVLTFSEPTASHAMKLNWCTVVIVLYVVFLGPLICLKEELVS